MRDFGANSWQRIDFEIVSTNHFRRNSFCEYKPKKKKIFGIFSELQKYTKTELILTEFRHKIRNSFVFKTNFKVIQEVLPSLKILF